jgi:hypothetical protein
MVRIKTRYHRFFPSWEIISSQLKQFFQDSRWERIKQWAPILGTIGVAAIVSFIGYGHGLTNLNWPLFDSVTELAFFLTIISTIFIEIEFSGKGFIKFAIPLVVILAVLWRFLDPSERIIAVGIYLIVLAFEKIGAIWKRRLNGCDSPDAIPLPEFQNLDVEVLDEGKLLKLPESFILEQDPRYRYQIELREFQQGKRWWPPFVGSPFSKFKFGFWNALEALEGMLQSVVETLIIAIPIRFLSPYILILLDYAEKLVMAPPR